jgi:hypothetical protein
MKFPFSMKRFHRRRRRRLHWSFERNIWNQINLVYFVAGNYWTSISDRYINNGEHQSQKHW